jgi:hypothetical protein
VNFSILFNDPSCRLSGVVLTHGSVLESAVGSLEVVGRVDGRVLQFANYTFDSSVWVSCHSLFASTVCPRVVCRIGV